MCTPEAMQVAVAVAAVAALEEMVFLESRQELAALAANQALPEQLPITAAVVAADLGAPQVEQVEPAVAEQANSAAVRQDQQIQVQMASAAAAVEQVMLLLIGKQVEPVAAVE